MQSWLLIPKARLPQKPHQTRHSSDPIIEFENGRCTAMCPQSPKKVQGTALSRLDSRLLSMCVGQYGLQLHHFLELNRAIGASHTVRASSPAYTTARWVRFCLLSTELHVCFACLSADLPPGVLQLLACTPVFPSAGIREFQPCSDKGGTELWPTSGRTLKHHSQLVN